MRNNVLIGSLPNRDGMLCSGLINRCQLKVWDAACVLAMKAVVFPACLMEVSQHNRWAVGRYVQNSYAVQRHERIQCQTSSQYTKMVASCIARAGIPEARLYRQPNS